MFTDQELALIGGIISTSGGLILLQPIFPMILGFGSSEYLVNTSEM